MARFAVSVSDTGVGLPPLLTTRIFNAFVTTKPRSIGIGLSISRSIIEEHGGRLWATNNPSRGADFHLTLPIGGEPQIDATSRAGRNAHVLRRNILAKCARQLVKESGSASHPG